MENILLKRTRTASACLDMGGPGKTFPRLLGEMRVFARRVKAADGTLGRVRADGAARDRTGRVRRLAGFEGVAEPCRPDDRVGITRCGMILIPFVTKIP